MLSPVSKRAKLYTACLTMSTSISSLSTSTIVSKYLHPILNTPILSTLESILIDDAVLIGTHDGSFH